MATPKVIIVTGAVRLPSQAIHPTTMNPPDNCLQNRGIGLAICKRILTTEPGISPLKLFAASRSGADLGLESSHATRSVIYPKLDISSQSSIREFADEVKQYGSVDVLINNAGVNLDDDYNAENAKKTIDVNYHGTLNVRDVANRLNP